MAVQFRTIQLAGTVEPVLNSTESTKHLLKLIDLREKKRLLELNIWSPSASTVFLFSTAIRTTLGRTVWFSWVRKVPKTIKCDIWNAHVWSEYSKPFGFNNLPYNIRNRCTRFSKETSRNIHCPEPHLLVIEPWNNRSQNLTVRCKVYSKLDISLSVVHW